MHDLTWVRFDLVAALADLAFLPDDAARGQYYHGMLSALASRLEPATEHGKAGWAFGSRLLADSIAYRDQQVAQRKAAAEARWSKGMRSHAVASPRNAVASPRNAEQCETMHNTIQDNTIQGGGSGFRSTGKSEQATAAATDEDLFPGKPQEGRFPAGSSPTPSQPCPAGDPRSLGMIRAATAQLRDASLADMRVLHPALLIMAEDRQAAEVSLRLYGGDAWRSVLGRLCADAKGRPKGKHRVMFNDLMGALAKTTKLSIDDFHRAGIDPPPWAVPQATLDAMPPQEFKRYGTP
jgi:hypothetical protein